MIFKIYPYLNSGKKIKDIFVSLNSFNYFGDHKDRSPDSKCYHSFIIQSNQCIVNQLKGLNPLN